MPMFGLLLDDTHHRRETSQGLLWEKVEGKGADCLLAEKQSKTEKFYTYLVNSFYFILRCLR